MPKTATTKTKKGIERNYTCPICKSDYITYRYSKTQLCSTSCRSKARSIKTANKRIEKLPYSDNWLWIARECERAGTVEILTDVDLEQLFSVYNRRYQCYGWDSDKKKSKFHLCHISPSKGKDTIGLLHHENLFIGSSLANQVQGNKSYSNAGLSIPKSALQNKWRVTKGDGEKSVLAKIKKFLGSTLTDYAKKHPIKKAPRFVLAERISKLDNNGIPLADLQKKSTQELMKLEAELKEKSVFTRKLTAKRSLVVYLEELERFASYNVEKRDDYLFVSAAVRVVAQYLSQLDSEHGLSSITASCYRWYYEFKPLELKHNKDLDKLRDFISFTAFSTLQGAAVNRDLITNTLRSYLQVESLTVLEHGVPAYDHTYTDYSYLQEEVDEYLSNVPKVKVAIELVGLVDSAALARISEKAKADSFMQAFNADMQCVDYHQYDYSDYNIQVEQEYSLPRLTDVESWLPF
jgi:hypothetical protein